MTIQTRLKQLREGAEYWAEVLVHEFTDELDAARRARQMTRSEMADRMGVNKAYVTKLFNGNANFTVLTMARAARALGLRVHIHVAPTDVEVDWVERPSRPLSPLSSDGERPQQHRSTEGGGIASVRDEPKDRS